MSITIHQSERFNNFKQKEYEKVLHQMGKFFTDGIYLNSKKGYQLCLNKDIIKFYNEQMFIEACCSVPLDLLRQMYELSVHLKNPIDINAMNERGISAFIQCCKFGRLRVAKWLYDLSHKLDTPIKNFTNDDYDKSPFYACCSSEHSKLSMAKWLYELSIEQGASISIHGPYDNDGLFIFTQNPEISQWLCELGNKFDSPINIHANNDHAFKLRCSQDLESAKWLYHYSKEIGSPININDDNEHLGVKYNAFMSACESGQIHIAKWLYQLGIDNNIPIDIRINNDFAFRNACLRATEDGTFNEMMGYDHNNYLAIAHWLCTLCDKYSFTAENDKIINYQIIQ